ncbi:MAG: hypothetical protein PHD15_06595 [Clostridia bacterium]|nr:hypothetical protein [Clostridia bacterium]MDD4387399.1 hypothetical protein [Clostridia bacterium]
MKHKKILISVLLFILLIISGIILYSIYLNYTSFTKVGGFTQKEIDKSRAVSNVANLSLVHIRYNILDDTKGYTIEDEAESTITREYILILNKDNKVIDVRAKETGYSIEGLEQQYNKLIGINNLFTNLSIQNNSLYYNTNFLNGNTLEEIQKSLSSQPNYKYTVL